MPDIRPISDLRSRFAEISKLAHENGEPIFLTKNGYGDLVVLSVEAYEVLVRQAKSPNTPPHENWRGIIIGSSIKRQPFFIKEKLAFFIGKSRCAGTAYPYQVIGAGLKKHISL